MKTKLICNDGTERLATIPRTALTAPEVICWNGKFFKIRQFTANKAVGNELYSKGNESAIIEYRECRGEYLNNLEVADSE